ncbi:MAG TPA: sodium:solute symporter [Cryomorphaceae bacterium]|nr:sodium:solute symporter [Cryomorphaceae bacterium]
MSNLDYAVMIFTLVFIVAFGVLKTLKSKNIQSYFLGDNQLKWGTIGLSVMATQASAITFLSTPGLAYESGMAFVQNYLGLPVALIIVSAVFIPIYYKLKVYTAYEYLESRFDLKSRLLAAFLFLVQRGLAAGITIYAPAIVLSSVLNWDLTTTILLVGVLVIIYTVSGGSKAVSLTQKWQMGIILIGMGIAFATIIGNLPEGVGIINSLEMAGSLGKTQAINFNFDIKERYTFWSGITGGLFLALAYFGTDQSQVQRYLGGKSPRESRLGLMFNAVLKIPMQFFILLTGVMVFVFFIFQDHDVLFDTTSLKQLEQTESAEELHSLRSAHQANHKIKEAAALNFINADSRAEESEAKELLQTSYKREKEIRDEAKALVIDAFPENTQRDSDYIFISYILNFMPRGLIGLLIAVILSAAMSSTAGELNALGSTTSVDFYKRVIKPGQNEKHYLNASKWLTAFWGVVAVSFALVADLLENLIEAVNILGSLFYGPVLGIFIVAFFIKVIKGSTVFFAAIASQAVVLIGYFYILDSISYLLFNVIGCALVILFSFILFPFLKNR